METRTQAQVADRLRDVFAGGDDVFGFQAEVLAAHLDLEHVTEFAKEGADLSDWDPSPMGDDALLAELRSYLEFAWGKATDHRGISAGRSVTKLGELLWLLGPEADELRAKFDAAPYPNYGAPQLMLLTKALEMDLADLLPSEWDREAAERMARGEQCRQEGDPGPGYCSDGCA